MRSLTAALSIGLLLPLASAQAQRLPPSSGPVLWDGSISAPQAPRRSPQVNGMLGTLLDFEGLGNQEAVLNFYDGGLGGDGSGPGPAFGALFTPNGLALTTGNYSNNPSPPTILFWVSGANTFLNRSDGFFGQVSFHYSAAANPGVVTLHSEVDGGGDVLASVVLPLTPTLPPGDTTFNNWQPFVIPFAGTARSIGFGGTANQIGFDDIVLGNLGGAGICADLTSVVGVWAEQDTRCGNFTSTTTTARYETAIFESSLPQTRGSAPGEYAYEVELVNNRPRQPSASTSIFVAGSPYPLRTATQNWDRAIAFNISGAGKYSVFRYNGSGLPVALQKWVFPAGVTINAAPASNVLRVERVSAGAGFNLRFFINGSFVRELADTLGVDQFGTGFVRSLATTGNLVTDDWMEVLDITLDTLPQNRGRVIPEISRAQQRANDAANASRGNDNPLFESTPDRR